MERIICDINRVPHEHFAEIADIAAQPEANSDLADLALAAFAQSKFLVECLRSALINGASSAVVTSALSGAALCDNCEKDPEKEKMETDGDNLYCEIVDGVEIRSEMEINETYSGGVDVRKSGSIKVEKIANSITALNQLVSQLTVRAFFDFNLTLKIPKIQS